MAPVHDLDPHTPVMVGVGQVSDRIDRPNYRQLSPVELAAEASRAAIADCGADPRSITAQIDTVAGIRQFENSTPIALAPLGRSDNYPRSVADRIGADPRRAILEVSGGQAPQQLVTEMARTIARTGSGVTLIFGSEAISTVRHLTQAERRPDFTEHRGGQLEDRGYGLEGLVSESETKHGLIGAPPRYALFENARRARLEQTRTDYALSMGQLFEPFTSVAARNVHAAAPTERTAAELATVTERNRIIADPYPRFMVSRDQVNQGAALLIMSVGIARSLGIPESKWVFLHGHADLREKDLLDRPDLSTSPAAVAATCHALEVAGIAAEQLSSIDLYSCFPIAVFNICDGLGLSPTDPRRLTASGGLPFFGGAGNNYSMHAIAETVTRLRSAPGSFGLVGANGGYLSKYSVGVYSTKPVEWRDSHSTEIQTRLDAALSISAVDTADGWAVVESYTTQYGRTDQTGIVVGRLEDGRRFLANSIDGDVATRDMLRSEQPIGQRVYARSTGRGNLVSTSVEAMNTFAAAPSSSSSFRG
ncbi:acetyl-CoA acetyltransferase [Nocardia vinacea]|uniref:acetyl-CoA acetyltransferase n=1 Tax=Nocardia vinacea TaxID=96468 RepID=UPI00068716F0|nr:acetyl-CoA acetyltransferase [Nocardia vinacea]